MTAVNDGSVMLTTNDVRAMTGLPVSTLHNSAANPDFAVVVGDTACR
jgi:hypothetical protein